MAIWEFYLKNKLLFLQSRFLTVLDSRVQGYALWRDAQVQIIYDDNEGHIYQSQLSWQQNWHFLMKTKESNPEKGLEWRPLPLGRGASDCFRQKQNRLLSLQCWKLGEVYFRNFYALPCPNFWNSKVLYGHYKIQKIQRNIKTKKIKITFHPITREHQH